MRGSRDPRGSRAGCEGARTSISGPLSPIRTSSRGFLGVEARRDAAATNNPPQIDPEPNVRSRVENRVKSVMRVHALDAVEKRTDGPMRRTNGALWSAASGRFQPVRLRAAIVARRWTVAEFSAASGVSQGVSVQRAPAPGGKRPNGRTHHPDTRRSRARELGRVREARQIDARS